MPKFVYNDYRGEHIITMLRAAPEWCNSDCPELTLIPDDTHPYSIKINDGSLIEAGVPDDIAKLFAGFFAASALACYKKYGWGKGLEDNGFWKSFTRRNIEAHGYSYYLLTVPRKLLTNQERAKVRVVPVNWRVSGV